MENNSKRKSPHNTEDLDNISRNKNVPLLCIHQICINQVYASRKITWHHVDMGMRHIHLFQCHSDFQTTQKHIDTQQVLSDR